MCYDILNVPFSYKGSYFAFSEFDDDGKNGNTLYLKNVRESGSSFKYKLFKIEIIKDGAVIPSKVTFDPSKLVMKCKTGSVIISFIDEESVLFTGEGDIDIKLTLTAKSSYNYTYNYSGTVNDYTIINIPRYRMKCGLCCKTGDLELSRKWNGITDENIFALIKNRRNRFSFVIVEFLTTLHDREYNMDANRAAETNKKDFIKFMDNMPAVPLEYQTEKELASYINWSSIVKKSRFLTRDAMYMSKNDMCNIWNWDNCMNAIVLSHNYLDFALDQILIMFDYQDSFGNIPDLSKALYDKLESMLNWWHEYRDTDNDGICEYLHGNDSGWDNSTVFINQGPVESADLQTFLVLQMECLEKLADIIGDINLVNYWKVRQDATITKMLEHCFVDNMPVAKTSLNHKIISNKSLLNYIPLLLGKKLPEDVRETMINSLVNGNYMTKYGLATEPVDSEHFCDDGYWRGAIWGISTVLITEGLQKCDKDELAYDIAKRFCEMVKVSGLAENYSAIDGRPLRDKAFTWTASCFLYLANHYLFKQSDIIK